MREISVNDITAAVREMCIEVNHRLSPAVQEALLFAAGKEGSETGKSILAILRENLQIAAEKEIPICQDTGMAVVFVTLGQEVRLTGGGLTEAINEGVRQGYKEGYLRKSVVSDPLDRVNSGDNTPAMIYYDIVPGDTFTLRLTAKGFGSENTSRVIMLKPSDGIEGVKKAVLETVKNAGPNACPPLFVGVGIGGTFEKAAMLAKLALLKDGGETAESLTAGLCHDAPYVKTLEDMLLREINALGIGPAGLGGSVTALAVHVLTAPTHIAGLPMAVNICCHVNRHAKRTL
ncbi:MAG: fumarate hydratase [Lachnospiraceae bacterium]|nr:fumarate hydratase [Lachnospiraceae bacterium]